MAVSGLAFGIGSHHLLPETNTAGKCVGGFCFGAVAGKTAIRGNASLPEGWAGITGYFKKLPATNTAVIVMAGFVAGAEAGMMVVVLMCDESVSRLQCLPGTNTAVNVLAVFVPGRGSGENGYSGEFPPTDGWAGVAE